MGSSGLGWILQAVISARLRYARMRLCTKPCMHLCGYVYAYAGADAHAHAARRSFEWPRGSQREDTRRTFCFLNTTKKRTESRARFWPSQIGPPVPKQGPLTTLIQSIRELRTRILDGLTQADSYFKGWNSCAHRESPRNLDSEILILRIDRRRCSHAHSRFIPRERA